MAGHQLAETATSLARSACTEWGPLCWIEAHPGLAGWVSGAGTIIALGVTIYVMRRTLQVMQRTTDQLLAEGRAREERDRLAIAQAEYRRAARFHALWEGRAASLLAALETWQETAHDPKTLALFRSLPAERFSGAVTDAIEEFRSSYKDEITDSSAVSWADMLASIAELFASNLYKIACGDYGIEGTQEIHTALSEAKENAYRAHKHLRSVLRHLDAANLAIAEGRQPPAPPVLLPWWDASGQHLSFAQRTVVD